MQSACALFYSHLWPAWMYHSFHISSQTARFSEKNFNEHKMHDYSLQRLSETLVILRIIPLDILIKVHRSACKVPIILVRFSSKLNFFTDFLNIHKYKISWKSHQWKPSCSIRTDRHDEANSRFSQTCDTRLQIIDGNSLFSEHDKVCSDHNRSRCPSSRRRIFAWRD